MTKSDFRDFGGSEPLLESKSSPRRHSWRVLLERWDHHPDVIPTKLSINDVFRVYYRMGMFGTTLARRKRTKSDKR